jgi:hypothetical protein
LTRTQNDKGVISNNTLNRSGFINNKEFFMQLLSKLVDIQNAHKSNFKQMPKIFFTTESLVIPQNLIVGNYIQKPNDINEMINVSLKLKKYFLLV